MPGFSPKYPLTVNSTDGHFGMNKTIVETIRQNIKNLVLTIPGERIMDSNYGVGLKKFLFEFPDSAASALSTEIQYQFGIYLPQVALLDVNVLTSEDDPDISKESLSVQISYAVPSIGITDSVTIEDI